VLTVLPIITLGMIEMLSPEYLGRLTNDPLGRNLLAAAAVSQILGYVVMKMICNIEV
jgi:Flp pilus assembly protein TadB